MMGRTHRTAVSVGEISFWMLALNQTWGPRVAWVRLARTHVGKCGAFVKRSVD